jgi:membrane protease subunit HflC
VVGDERQIYADSYKKDPEFFSVRSMEVYRKSFAGNDLMVLKPDSEFFRYLKSPHGNKQ